MLYKLITQTPICEGLDYLIEEGNKDKPANIYVSGVYMVAEEKNRNNRIYSRDEMAQEVARYNEEFVKTNRALGELEHPNSANVSSERACHLITELRMDGNLVKGKSKILRTPLGEIMKSLVMDGVKMGMSSRALGTVEEKNGTNFVKNMKLITVDAVADPSAPGAFVNGILESKQFVLSTDGKLEEVYESFEKSIRGLPKHDVATFLKEQIMSFLSKL